MFKESATARTFLRAGISTALAVLGAIQLGMVDGITSQEWVGVGIAGCIALGGYLGVGAVSGSAEPFFVRELENVEVPIPPATPDKP